jgi:DNA-directed RNA polymerase subunit RPC12/RpoP
MNVKEGIKDRTIVCADCGREFTFTIGEQRYFQSKSLTTPRRCPQCRERRKRTLVPDEGVEQ